MANRQIGNSSQSGNLLERAERALSVLTKDMAEKAEYGDQFIRVADIQMTPETFHEVLDTQAALSAAMKKAH
jgi:hypothetical protein